MTNTLTKERRIFFWVSMTLLFFCFLYLIRSVLLPFVLGMATAYFLDPAADRLQRWKLSRGIATLIITCCFFSIIGITLLFVIPLIAGQISELLTAIPSYIIRIEQELLPLIEQKLQGISPSLADEIKNSITSSSGLIARTMGDFFANILSSGMAFVNILSLILITPIVAFYLLRDWDYITAHIDSLLPRTHAPVIREQLAIINTTLAGFIRGQLNVCILLGLFYAISLTIIGLNFGFLIGIATGFLVIFPYVGLLLGMVTGLTVAFFQFATFTPIAMVLSIFIIGQLVEGNFITPKLVGDKVGLHPVWIIFAMLAGAALFGFVGVLLAVPIAAVLGVLIRFAATRYQSSTYFQ